MLIPCVGGAGWCDSCSLQPGACASATTTEKSQNADNADDASQ
jgi:hypothetical protein